MDRASEPLDAGASHAAAMPTPLQQILRSYSRAHPAAVAAASGPSQPLARSARASAAGRDFVPLVYLLAILVVESITVLANVRLGTALHACVLAALLVHASFSEGPHQRLLLGLSLAPLIRILSLSLPLQHVPLLYWYGIVAIPLLAAVFIAARTAKLSRRDLGIAVSSLPIQILVAASGLVLGLTEFLILRPQPLIHELTWSSVWFPAVIMLVGTGMAEEVAFRGVMQSAARPVLGGLTVIYVSIIFAVLHIGYRSALDFIFVLGVGLYFGYIAWWTRSIVGTSLSHGLANIMLYLVLPFAALPAIGAHPSPPPRGLPQAQNFSPPAIAVGAISEEATPVARVGGTLVATSGSEQAQTATVDSEQTPAAAAASADSSGYVVRPGDSLSAIAARYGATSAAMAVLNSLSDPNHITPGQRLLLTGVPPPAAARSPTLAQPASPQTGPSASLSATGAYLVQAGDTLSGIAVLFGTSVSSLEAINGLVNPSDLRSGVQLQVVGAPLATPAGGTSGTVALPPPEVVAPPVPTPRTAQISSAAAATRVAPPAFPADTRYIVRSGDTLGTIAAQYETTPAALAALNGLGSAVDIYVGEQLFLPEPP